MCSKISVSFKIHCTKCKFYIYSENHTTYSIINIAIVLPSRQCTYYYKSFKAVNKAIAIIKLRKIEQLLFRKCIDFPLFIKITHLTQL